MKTLWAWKDELKRRGFAQTWPNGCTEEAVRACSDAVLAEQSALNAAALRWDYRKAS